MVSEPFSQPGFVEEGSEEWIKDWKGSIQKLVRETMTTEGFGGEPYAPMTTRCLLKSIELGQEYKAWTKLKDKDGKPFKRFRDFCEYPIPLGLGTKYDRLCRYLKDNLGEKATAILVEANPESKPGSPTDRDESGRFTPATNSSLSAELENGTTRLEQQHKAIARAPALIRELHCKDLIGKAQAEKFGPYLGNNPAPSKLEAQEKALVVAGKLEKWVSDNPPPQEPKAKRAYKAKVNKVVGELFGVKKKTVVISLEETGSQIAERLQQRLTPEQLTELCEALKKLEQKE